jgi:hypothetical protein
VIPIYCGIPLSEGFLHHDFPVQVHCGSFPPPLPMTVLPHYGHMLSVTSLFFTLIDIASNSSCIGTVDGRWFIFSQTSRMYFFRCKIILDLIAQ